MTGDMIFHRQSFFITIRTSHEKALPIIDSDRLGDCTCNLYDICSPGVRGEIKGG